MRYFLFLLTIVSSAFLLFQIQPILAKSLLPIYGGGASIWTSSMLFFQVMLFLGYCHAYFISLLPKTTIQFTIQISLLIMSWFIAPNIVETFGDSAATPPEISILLTLGLQVALPFYLLSSTGVLLQYWYTQFSDSQTSPYPYYAWSNFGSLVALLSYPFWFESQFGLTAQKGLWLIGYKLFISCNLILIAFLYLKSPQDKATVAAKKKHRCSPSKIALWISFSATGVMMLLSTTQILTLNISPMPFLWVLPLSLYLLSYIVSFSAPKLYVRSMWQYLLLLSIVASFLMFFWGSQFNSLSQIIMYCTILFVLCVICHSELRLSAPANHTLTLFYLCIAAGGMLGGLFVSLVAPIIFSRLTEYSLTIYCIYLLTGMGYFKRKTLTTVLWWLGAAVLPIAYYLLDNAYTKFDIANNRNFYGYLSVKEHETNQGIERTLVDGTTVHGSQVMSSSSHQQNHYYGPTTGVSVAIQFAQQLETMNMAVIGLGAGVLAGYGRENDKITFYEINPAVKEFAESYFDYIYQSPAKVEIILGDGRLSMEKALSRVQIDAQKLDILVIDAFSSGAIPTHLLTKEAFALYWQHLHKEGLLVIHISNSHLNLRPIINAQAELSNQTARLFKTVASQTNRYGSEWVVITNNLTFLNQSQTQRLSSKLNIPKDNKALWSDDFIDVLSTVK